MLQLLYSAKCIVIVPATVRRQDFGHLHGTQVRQFRAHVAWLGLTWFLRSRLKRIWNINKIYYKTRVIWTPISLGLEQANVRSRPTLSTSIVFVWILAIIGQQHFYFNMWLVFVFWRRAAYISMHFAIKIIYYPCSIDKHVSRNVKNGTCSIA
jgi:hypothetical protein